MRLADCQYDHLARLFVENGGDLNPDLALDILDTGPSDKWRVEKILSAARRLGVDGPGVTAVNTRHFLRGYRLIADGTLAFPLWSYRSDGNRAAISVRPPFDIEVEGVTEPDDEEWNRWYYRVARTLAISRQCRFENGIAALVSLPHRVFDCRVEFFFEGVSVTGPEQGITNLIAYGGLLSRVVEDDGTLAFPDLERDHNLRADPAVHTPIGGYTRAVAEAKEPTPETVLRRKVGL